MKVNRLRVRTRRGPDPEVGGQADTCGWIQLYIDTRVCVCFSMSVTSLSCFHNMHLVFRGPSAAQGGSLDDTPGIWLCNKAKSLMGNLLVFPVLFLILPAVGLQPLWPRSEQSAGGCH